jgi:hypothetical protein
MTVRQFFQFERSADWQSAKRQAGSLRYGVSMQRWKIISK